ncbi:hypothetical protein [Labrenzia sp. CE80]|uniref:hypothetical protein n=1 Tax=Labrenzia sp. CE80 TaxID=1788986 RepID=UPI00129B8FD9|nr:hypothetical protein [Labrenzia sp. CE80]
MDHATSASRQGRLDSLLKHGESKLLVVVFSQVRVPAGKFGLERLFAKTRHNCLFLNDTGCKWYLGLEHDIDAAISAAIGDVSPERVIYYGSSMGGYGALLTGLRRRDGDIHAFGPELRLGRPGYQSTVYEIDLNDQRLVDFKDLAEAYSHELNLYFGCFDAVDAAGASAAWELLPKARRHLLRSTHANHDHLYSLNIIRRLIRTFERDPGRELASKRLSCDITAKDLRAFGDLGEAFASGAMVDPADIAKLYAFQVNPGLMRLTAEIHAKAGDLDAALETMEMTEALVGSDPVLQGLPKRWRKQLPLLRVNWLHEAGRTEMARQLLTETLERFPADEAMLTLSKQLGLGSTANKQPSVTDLPIE